jgi:anthranilate synthase component 1
LGNLVPVYREILADLETPVSAFLKLQRDQEYAYLLESVQGGEKWARYSLLGSNPSRVLIGRDGGVDLQRGGVTERIDAPDGQLAALQSVMRRFRPVEVEGLPRFFGGAVGYIGYDLVRQFERLPERAKPSLELPDMVFMLTDTLVIFDNVTQKIRVVSNAHLENQSAAAAYREATAKIDAIVSRLRARLEPDIPPPAPQGAPPVHSNLTPGEFEKMVLTAKEYIRGGDIFQVVLSQRFDAPLRCDPFQIYRALRLINPSPYMYYLKLGPMRLIGSSPEVLVRCEDDAVEVRPIAGTRPRGRTPELDRDLEQELLADTKERAEHIMLVDLGRNDIGRVSQFGSVHVDELLAVERYSHVMHLVSHVQGRLQQPLTAYDVLRACFPAGTVSGAPKIRAMEIIEELEPTRRGPYAGAVGYFSFSGNLDACINIRTIVVDGDHAYVQAGAGIVADSDPHTEYQETVNKARAMIAAIELAEKGLE